MLFSSPAFFIFFLAYFCFHLIVPKQYRIYLIICGSTIFYAWWKVSYAWLPYFLMAVAYCGAIWLDRAAEPVSRKWRTVITIVVLFIPLLFFKYTNFIYGDVLGPFFEWHGKILDLPLPLGVSFVTFTLTAYVVDIYRGQFAANSRPSVVLAYVLFFPHLIAGPILRPNELIPQLERPRRALFRYITPGIAIFTAGLIKKLVFADQIAQAVDAVYAPGVVVTAPAAILAIYGFSIQIYCDFSGYTDMAIGVALLLGVRLPINFLSPYCAISLVDFWRRWHITLSFWLRNYLYIPLGGNRGGRIKEIRNIIVTMALGGLWHGANWTFVIWGLLQGLGVSVVHLISRDGRVARNLEFAPWIKVLITFHFVTFCWIFFRSPNLRKVGEIVAAPFVGSWVDVGSFVSANRFQILLIIIALALHYFDNQRHIKAVVRRVRPEIVWPVLVFCWALAITVNQGNSAKFIYFDF